MREIEKVQLQCAIVQMQARAIDSLYNLLSQHKTIEGREVEIPTDQADAIEIQEDIINELFREVSKYLSTEELDRLECIKEINEAAGLRKCLDRAH